MKKLLLYSFLMLSVIGVSAQEKGRDVVDDDYVRNSLSVIIVNKGDSYDQMLQNTARTFSFGQKFDFNKIGVSSIMIRSSRGGAVDVDAIASSLEKGDVGKQIVSFWFQRSEDGMMSDELILKRGMYSVRDQDILNSQVSKIGVSALGERGYGLIQGSYLYVLDYYNVKEEKEAYSIDLKGVIFKLDFDEDLMEQVYQAWIYEDDPPEVRAQKNRLYESLTFPLVHVATVSATGHSSVSVSDAAREAYSNALYKSEKAVDQWKVTSSIVSVKPLKAKIGTKEGVRNGQRFQVHKIVEDSQGNVDSRKVGYVRATEVANNSSVATGHSAASSFYQISGLRIEEGMILKQKNDLRVGITVSAGFGVYSPLEIGLEYLEHINTKGTSRYILLNMGFDSYRADEFSSSISYVNFGIGYGVAFRPVRPIEIMPFLQIGMDVISSPGGKVDNYKFEEWTGWTAKAGARVSWQIVYPVQIFAQGNLSAILGAGEYYSAYNDYLKGYGKGHKSAVAGLSFGLKINL